VPKSANGCFPTSLVAVWPALLTDLGAAAERKGGEAGELSGVHTYVENTLEHPILLQNEEGRFRGSTIAGLQSAPSSPCFRISPNRGTAVNCTARIEAALGQRVFCSRGSKEDSHIVYM